MESLFKLKISYSFEARAEPVIKELSISGSGFVNSLKEAIRETFGIPEAQQNLYIRKDGTEVHTF